MSKNSVRKSPSKKGRTKHNRQWIREHKAHRAKLFFGDIDKLTGEKKK